MYRIFLSELAQKELQELRTNPALSKRHKAVRKAIGFLQANPRHPGLNTHKYKGFSGNNGEEVFEAYAENRTPGAYRIFWHYGSEKETITILAITPHP